MIPVEMRCTLPSWREPWQRWRTRWWFRVDRRRSALAAAERDSVPILAVVGANGGGKTACAVYGVLRTLDGRRWECDNADHLHRHAEDCPRRRGWDCECDLPGPVEGWRTVLSTVRLFDDSGELHPRYVPFRRYQDLVHAEHCDVLMDEATGVASARQHQSLPVQVENLIVQQRRRDIRLIWTTPDYSAADVRIRQVTQGVVYCSGGAPVRSRIEGHAWRENRLFRWTLYDASQFEEFTATQRLRGKPLSVQYVWRPGHRLERAYDTMAAVQALGVATEGGMCMSCGGSRSRPRCSCPADPGALPVGVLEEVDGRGTRRRRVVPVAEVS